MDPWTLYGAPDACPYCPYHAQLSPADGQNTVTVRFTGSGTPCDVDDVVVIEVEVLVTEVDMVVDELVAKVDVLVGELVVDRLVVDPVPVPLGRDITPRPIPNATTTAITTPTTV